MHILLKIIFSLIAITFIGCTSSNQNLILDPEVVAEQLKKDYERPDSAIDIVNGEVARAYRLNGYRLLWFQSKLPKQALLQYFTNYYSLHDEGIDITSTKLSVVNSITNAINKIYEIPDYWPIDSIIRADQSLTKAYIAASYMLSFGNDFDMINGDKYNAWTSLNVANNLVFALNNADVFPSFDIYRPQNEIYAALFLAIKSWMLLGQDKEYLSLKRNLIEGKIVEDDVVEIMRKELNLDSVVQVDKKEIIKSYQYKRGLPQTGEINQATLAFAKMKPEEYRKKIKINLERLRHFPSHQSAFVSYNVLNRRLVFWVNGKIEHFDTGDLKNDLLYRVRLIGKENVEEFNRQNNDAGYAYLSDNGAINIVLKTLTNTITETINFFHKKEIMDKYEKLGIRQLIANSINTKDAFRNPFFIKTYFTSVMDPVTKKIIYFNDDLGLDSTININ